MVPLLRRIGFVAIFSLVFLVVLADTASAASITVTPASTSVGGAVTLSGDVLANGTPGCTVPGTVTLISPGFAGLGEFAGVGAVNLPVDATGHFSSSVTLRSTVPPGTYSISGRCGGGNLGVTATLTVTGLAATGATIAGHDPATVAVFAVTVAGLGAVLMSVARRKRQSA